MKVLYKLLDIMILGTINQQLNIPLYLRLKFIELNYY